MVYWEILWKYNVRAILPGAQSYLSSVYNRSSSLLAIKTQGFLALETPGLGGAIENDCEKHNGKTSL